MATSSIQLSSDVIVMLAFAPLIALFIYQIVKWLSLFKW